MKNFLYTTKLHVLGDAIDSASIALGLPAVPFTRMGPPYNSKGEKVYDLKAVADHIIFLAQQTGVTPPSIPSYSIGVLAHAVQSLLIQLVSANRIPDNLFG